MYKPIVRREVKATRKKRKRKQKNLKRHGRIAGKNKLFNLKLNNFKLNKYI